MIKFRAIQILSIMPINKRIRELVDKINELEARLDALTGAQGETVADEASQVVTVNERPEEPKEESTLIEDELRQKAKGLGVKRWHLKSIHTLTDEIASIEAGD